MIFLCTITWYINCTAALSRNLTFFTAPIYSPRIFGLQKYINSVSRGSLLFSVHIYKGFTYFFINIYLAQGNK